MSANLKIDYLPADPAIQCTVAEWHHQEWKHLSERTLEDRIAEFAEHLNPNSVPLTVLGWIEGKPVASASLLIHDMDIHPDWSPWLASVFVLPHLRRQGVGRLLVARIEEEAARLGVPKLYLYTPDRAPFYQYMNWESLEEINYHGEQVTLMEKVIHSAPSGS